MKSAILKKRTIAARFNFDITKQQAADMLLGAYMAEVEYRQRSFISDEAIMGHINWLAEVITNPTHKFGIMFAGTCGNGKTTLLYALRSMTWYLAKRGVFTENPESRLLVITARELIETAKNYQAFNKLKEEPFLAIDDVGVEASEVMSYGNVLNPINELLEQRYNQQLFTAITTNIQPKDFRDRYGVRLADRFNEIMDVRAFEEKSYRTKSA